MINYRFTLSAYNKELIKSHSNNKIKILRKIM